MMEFLQQVAESNTAMVAFRILLAVLLGGVIGNERGKHGSQAGLRTHILVCLGATMTALVGVYAVEVLGYSGDPFRIAAQVVSGIGFLGAGMIIVKNGNAVTGLTTAAGMWTTATIGIALGVGFYSGALILAAACVFTAAFLTRMERKRKKYTQVYLEVSQLSAVEAVGDRVKELLGGETTLEWIPARSKTEGALGLYAVTTQETDLAHLRQQLHTNDAVSFVVVDS